MVNVDGKVALITGGAGGIGLGMATAFLAAGMKVALADVDVDALNSTVSTLDCAKDRVLPVRLDVTSTQNWEDAVRAVEEHLGPVQILCNNAGVTSAGHVLKQALFEELTIEEWDWTHDVNVSGMFRGVCAILPRLRRSGLAGHIVNTASMAALIAFPGMPASYTSSKFAALGLSEQLRADLQHNGPQSVGVSVLFPGHTRTRIMETSASLSPVRAEPHTSDLMERVRQRLDQGVAPVLIGGRVLRGIRANEFYIFSHPEYKPLIEQHFQKMSAAFAEAADPSRADPMPAQG